MPDISSHRVSLQPITIKQFLGIDTAKYLHFISCTWAKSKTIEDDIEDNIEEPSEGSMLSKMI